MADFKVKRVQIPQGKNISDSFDLGDVSVVSIQMPSAWNAAALTFQAGDNLETSGGVFYNLYDTSGNEISITTAASRVVNATVLASLRYLKVRSGTASVPVTQTATREIVFLCKEY